MEHLTHWEDENGNEYDIKISYTIFPEEPMQPNPDHPHFGPGCDAEVDVDVIYRSEPYGDGFHWVEFDDESDAEYENWKTEIMEAESGQ